MYAKNISLFQFFEQIIGIVKFWDRSEPMGLFGYYIYLSIFLNSLLYIFKNKEIKYSISIYFIFPVLFIIIYSAITTPAFIARQFISLSLLSTIFIANLFKNKKYMNLLIAIILLNIYQSITIIPNFRYLSFTNHEKLIMNNSNTISLLYPYSDLDSIDYYLRTSGFIRDLSQYNPVIFKNDTKIIYAYPSEIERLSDHNLVLIHGDIIHNNNYYKIIENECNLTKNEIDNLIYKNQSYIFYECNIL